MEKDCRCYGFFWFRRYGFGRDVKFLLKIIVKRILKEYLFCYEVEDVKKGFYKGGWLVVKFVLFSVYYFLFIMIVGYDYDVERKIFFKEL